MRTRLVVVNEHTLGYIIPAQPNQAGILQASILRGATHSWMEGPLPLSSLDKVRTATRADFDTFHVHFGSFGNPAEYELAA